MDKFLHASTVKKLIKSFENLEDAYDWLESTNRLKSFAWLLSSVVLERAGVEKKVGYEIHHIIPLRNGLSKKVLLDINNFKYISKEEHNLIEKGKGLL